MIREIKIKAVLNGYVVNVGCQTLVFQSRQALISELDSYLDQPDLVEKRYRDTALNKDILNVPAPQEATANTPEMPVDAPRCEPRRMGGATLGPR